jgi:arsenate reductase
VKATIYHNPNCGTSRNTLELLRESGADVNVVEYLKTPPSRDELKRLYDRAGLKPSEGLRTREEAAAALREAGDEEAVLDAMVADPILIERPLVETEKGVRLCRPKEKVQDIL